MNSADAKKVLVACRPGTDDMRDAAVLAALEQAGRDPALRQWWEEQQKFHAGLRECFRQVPAPHSLRDRILARRKIISVAWWRRPVALSAAAAIALLIACVALWPKTSQQNTFAVFRERMVGNVQRQYAMTIRTNDMKAIQQHLAATNAPADYALPPGLMRLPALGAGVLSWQDRRVSMVCLDSQKPGVLFLFVVDAVSVKNPPKDPEYASVNSMATVSWTENGRTYVLAESGPVAKLPPLR